MDVLIFLAVFVVIPMAGGLVGGVIGAYVFHRRRLFRGYFI
jgi:hypothetical protein